MGRRPKARGRDVHGIVLLDKPLGLSSNQALQRVKRLFNANRAGHTGTLDPMATGLLPICLGEATKVATYLTDSDKAYTATLQLGESTATGDSEGEILHTTDIPSDWQTNISEIMNDLVGGIDQVPPMFSAIKINGQPLYKLAREGKEVVRKSRQVTVYELSALTLYESSVDFYVRCSKGTYVRTLGEQIAERLGCAGHLTALRRTQVSPYQSNDMVTLQQLEQLKQMPDSPLGNDSNQVTERFASLDAFLRPVSTALFSWPCVVLNESQARAIVHGQAVSVRALDNPPPVGFCRLMYQDTLLALGELSEKGALRSKRLLHLINVIK